MPWRTNLIWVLLAVACVAAGAAAGPADPLPSRERLADDPAESVPLPVPDPTPLAVRYHRTGHWVWAASRAWEVAVPAVLLLTGASAGIRNIARRVGRSWYGTVCIYLVLFLAIRFVVGLPVRYYLGFVRQHAYGLSDQTLAKWLSDGVKALGVEAAGLALFGWVPFWLIGRFPKRWWLILTGLWAPFAAFTALVAPVWIAPLFNDFGPMKDKALEAEILALARRAGIPGSRVYEVNKSVDTNALNAYVVGLFGTKRVVLWDTLLARLDDREVLAVVGHEAGHYVLNHIPKGLALSAFALLAGLLWVDRAGRALLAPDRWRRRFGFDSLADVAATPLLLLLLAASSVVIGPIGLALSRYHEREADRFALDLTRANRSAARAFADLQRNNLSVPYHSWPERLFRDTHPTIGERIEFCNRYHPWRLGR